MKKNFEDEEVVKNKVLALKKEAVASYLKETTNHVEPFDKAKHFEYYIEVDGKLYKKKEETAAAIRELSEKFSSQYEPREIDSADYVNNGISIPFTVELEYPASVITVKLLNTIYGDEIENFEWRKIAFYVIWGLTLLAIAQSIVELHGGTMEIELIGDLFQVTVRLPL